MRWFGWFRRKRSATLPAGVPPEMLDGSPIAMIGGRVRKVGVPYAMPADAEEINRLDFQHYMLRYALQGNYASPIESPASILDVGTGTGRWAREMAQEFPAAKVLGVDITPPPADEPAGPGALDLRPHNYAFAAANVLEGLPFPDASFDFVHMRLLYLAIPRDRWPFVISELVRVARPGGWVESLEGGLAAREGPMMALMQSWSTSMLARRAVDLRDGERVPDLMRSAGLANVTAHRVDIPLGSYGGRIGSMMATDLLTGAEGLGGLVVQMGLATREQFDQTIAGLRAELNSAENRAVFPFFVAFGQRIR
jgi:ubiquinone/menaquinone biosynthesis C-methylase UbiE